MLSRKKIPIKRNKLKRFSWGLFSKNNKGNDNSNKPTFSEKRQSEEKKSRIFRNSNSGHIDQTVYKIFKPKDEELLREKIKNALPINNNKQKKFSFGIKNVEFLNRKSSLLNLNNSLKQVRFYVSKWQIMEQFNKIISTFVIASCIIFLVFISFFDTHFLVKTYTVNFEDGSYLNETEVNQVLKSIREQKLLGIFPNNQYWFINDYNLTWASQKAIPEIQYIQVADRSWPNKISLNIKTEPILVTLGITENNQSKYWRITQTGKVLTEDTLGLQENLVTISLPVSFDKVGASLKSFPLEQNSDQINRLWFIVWLWEMLKSSGVQYTSTSIPSLIDTDVNIVTTYGTNLIFNSASLGRENQATRIEKLFLTQSIQDRHKQGKLAYIDFRIPKKIFVCEKGKECDK